MTRLLEEVLTKADAFFGPGGGRLGDTLRALARRLEEAKIPYAIMGSLAAGAHGYRRLTEDVDVLTTPEGLAAFKARFLGRGYVPRFPGSERSFRDTETGAPVDFVLSGGYPGTGRPGPVAFPDPPACSAVTDGIRVLTLETLVELKLASGISSPDRLRDLADVLELIRANRLDESFAGPLHPSVRAKYSELLAAARSRREEGPPA